LKYSGASSSPDYYSDLRRASYGNPARQFWPAWAGDIGSTNRRVYLGNGSKMVAKADFHALDRAAE